MMLNYKNINCLDQQVIEKIVTKLEPEFENMVQARKVDYDSPYASINLVYDQPMLTKIKQVIDQKKRLKPSILVVIGIGGSNLGTMAIVQALYGRFYNQKNGLKIYFADTVDTDYIQDILTVVEKELKKGNEVLLNVVSKSGKTTETIANFEIFLHLLQQYKTDYKKYIVVTTDANSALWNYAEDEKIACLEIPQKVGGRFSVFSAVGLFPLGMIGIDIDQLQEGARNVIESCTSKHENDAAISAAISYAHYLNGIIINNLFLFSVDLQAIGWWYRQLIAESLGKSPKIGIVPIVSVGSTDLHSMAQLYLGGPRVVFTQFVSVLHNKFQLTVPNYPKFDTIVANIQSQSLEFIMNSMLKGVEEAYKKDSRPFTSLVLPEKSAYYIAQFLQYKMIEVMYLGYLFEVNPFDQPHVEMYKKETRKILSQ